MPVANYRYQISVNGTWTEIPFFQDYSIQIGRQFQLDTYRADTCAASFWYQADVTGTSYDFYLRPGNPVRIYDDTRKVTLFYGQIKDIAVKYDIPYNASTEIGNADRMTIYAEGLLAVLGRMSGAGYSMAANGLQTQINDAQGQTGQTIVTLPPLDSTPMGATTVDGTWADWLNKAALTLNNRIRQTDDEVTIVSKYSLTQATVTFGSTASATVQKYNQIDFHTLSDNYYTQVTVDPEGFASQTSSLGAAPYRTYTVNTLNASTDQAKDYADYLLSNYSVLNPRIASVSAPSHLQGSNFYLDNLGLADGVNNFFTQNLVGIQTNVVFRNATYTLILEGLTVSGTPETNRFTFYVSAADLNAYLIFDNPVFGKLDENKLGF